MGYGGVLEVWVMRESTVPLIGNLKKKRPAARERMLAFNVQSFEAHVNTVSESSAVGASVSLFEENSVLFRGTLRRRQRLFTTEVV